LHKRFCGWASPKPQAPSFKPQAKQLIGFFDSGMFQSVLERALLVCRARKSRTIAMLIKKFLSRSAFAGLILLPAWPVLAAPATLDLVCTGNSFSKVGDPFPTEEMVSFQTDGKTVVVGLPGADKPTKAKITSSNPIQLKFSVAGLTGEYFNFSGDLFLIHTDGRFTRLVCQQKS
jgi:hypothetical protein